MKTTVFTLLTVLLFSVSTTTNLLLESNETNSSSKKMSAHKIDKHNKSGLEFYIKSSKVNSKYTELASSVFRNKLIMVSSKKIGGIGNGIDTNTQEPFTELFCLDIDAYGTVSNPLLFSRIINTKSNEGQVAFSPNEKTMYFTRSERDNSKNYQLYKTILKEDSSGNWTDELELAISSDTYSIENPFITADGTQLYFSSNMPGSLGGFDIFVCKIYEDGSLGKPENLGPQINTAFDEKFPHLSKHGKELYFSSKGHQSLGGFDIFVSKIAHNDYRAPRNLGTAINTAFDEVAFVFIDDSKGFFSSNKNNGKGSYDMYRFKANPIYQNLQGIVVSEANQPLPNSIVLLLDIEGQEIERQVTGIDAHYSFKVKAFEQYSIKVLKEGFEQFESKFSAQNIDEAIYKEILKLSPKVVSVSN